MDGSMIVLALSAALLGLTAAVVVARRIAALRTARLVAIEEALTGQTYVVDLFANEVHALESTVRDLSSTVDAAAAVSNGGGVPPAGRDSTTAPRASASAAKHSPLEDAPAPLVNPMSVYVDLHALRQAEEAFSPGVVGAASRSELVAAPAVRLEAATPVAATSVWNILRPTAGLFVPVMAWRAKGRKDAIVKPSVPLYPSPTDWYMLPKYVDSAESVRPRAAAWVVCAICEAEIAGGKWPGSEVTRATASGRAVKMAKRFSCDPQRTPLGKSRHPMAGRAGKPTSVPRGSDVLPAKPLSV